MKKFKIKSYCKINLTLKVVNKLNNGYHNIKSLITFSDLHDVISVSKIKGREDSISFYFDSLIIISGNKFIKSICFSTED